jgi:hypothetical protein
MARKTSKRSKQITDQGETTAAPATEQNTTPASERAVTSEPDIFDEAIAARNADQTKHERLEPQASGKSARIAAAMAAAPMKRASELEVPQKKTVQNDREAAESQKPLMPKIGDRLPDPRGLDQISLDNERDGEMMRLLRSHRHRDVWIQFDTNPGKAITEQIKAEGFRWEPRAEAGERNGAWVKPLEQGREVGIMLAAERLFKKLANEIRESKGLEPVGMTGVSAG